MSDEHATIFVSSLAIPEDLAEQFGLVCLDLRVANPDDAVREAIEQWCKGTEGGRVPLAVDLPADLLGRLYQRCCELHLSMDDAVSDAITVWCAQWSKGQEPREGEPNDE